MNVVQSLFIIFLSYQFFASLANAILSFKIARMRMSPTFTYSILTIAFTLRLGTYIWSIFYLDEILAFYSGFPSLTILTSYVIEALIMGLFLVFVTRKYWFYKHAMLVQ